MFNEEKIPFVKSIKSIHYLNLNNNQTEICKKRKISHDDDAGDDETDSHREYKRKQFKCIDIKKKKSSNEVILDDKILWIISNEYENLNEWKTLGNSLGLSAQDILLIEHKYKNDLLECFYQCLLKWRLRQPENCNWKFLSKFLKLNQSILESKNSRNYLEKMLESKQIDNLKLSEKFFWFASDLTCENWKSLGRFLGLKESTLNQIESKYNQSEGLRECCYQMFLIWSEQFYSDAYLHNFCLKLIDMNFKFYAVELLEFF
ncbi:unnamed protein product [Brachionus calyciflorus]|uniref:Death domain-containing protein n=1 Tax=Brachionus calyciflorus TaxID=104777 RepID=A0A813UH07_9BILA|nr:unnamed protein product [Brachionus calyciflorus]